MEIREYFMLDAGFEERINDYAVRAINFVNEHLNLIPYTEFNGIRVNVEKGMTPEKVVEQYNNKMKLMKKITEEESSND